MMDEMQDKNKRHWNDFQEKAKLGQKQIVLFQKYYDLLIDENKHVNLTAITGLRPVLSYHFLDSLALSQFYNCNHVNVIADVGAGAGFPSLPLKILYPHLKVLLIEVSHKRQVFLRKVIETLELKDVEVCPLDWRTFLRTTTGTIDLFVARASLESRELMRLFRHTCAYRASHLVYWASHEWVPDKKVGQYIENVEEYVISGKKRKLIFFKT